MCYFSYISTHMQLTKRQLDIWATYDPYCRSFGIVLLFWCFFKIYFHTSDPATLSLPTVNPLPPSHHLTFPTHLLICFLFPSSTLQYIYIQPVSTHSLPDCLVWLRLSFPVFYSVCLTIEHLIPRLTLFWMNLSLLICLPCFHYNLTLLQYYIFFFFTVI